MVLFMAASVAFLFLSFVLVSIHAWFYTDAAVRAAHVGTLQSLLASDEPATTKSDLAGRAGIGTNTVSNLESGRNVGFEAVVRVAMVLGRINELEGLFQPKLDSIEDIRRYEEAANRLRTKRKPRNA